MLNPNILPEGSQNKIQIKNIHLHDYVIILASNCSIHLYQNNNHVFIPLGSLFVLEKRLIIDLVITRESSGVLYELLRIDNETLYALKKYMNQY